MPEPTVEEAVLILQGLRERYETHHKLTYSEEAIDAAVKYAHQYISDRFLPDKAIDLIDEAGSRVRLRCTALAASTGLCSLQPASSWAGMHVSHVRALLPRARWCTGSALYMRCCAARVLNLL